MNTTGTATVTENSDDVTALTITITRGNGEEFDTWLETRAYENAAGRFDADCFDVNTFAADITVTLALCGWRPTEPITVDNDGSVTFAVETF